MVWAFISPALTTARMNVTLLLRLLPVFTLLTNHKHNCKAFFIYFAYAAGMWSFCQPKPYVEKQQCVRVGLFVRLCGCDCEYRISRERFREFLFQQQIFYYVFEWTWDGAGLTFIRELTGHSPCNSNSRNETYRIGFRLKLTHTHTRIHKHIYIVLLYANTVSSLKSNGSPVKV